MVIGTKSFVELCNKLQTLILKLIITKIKIIGMVIQHEYYLKVGC